MLMNNINNSNVISFFKKLDELPFINTDIERKVNL